MQHLNHSLYIKSSPKPITRNVIKWENIDKNAIMFIWDTVCFWKDCSFEAQFSSITDIVLLGSTVLQKYIIRQIALTYLHKPIIVFTRHTHIDIIIPWDESAVADCP